MGLYSQDGGSINVDRKDNIIEGDAVALVEKVEVKHSGKPYKPD